MASLGLTGSVWATVRNFFRKPWTVQYPAVVRPRAERYRASFALVHNEHGEEACVACLLCEKVCPSQVIKVKQGAKKESAATGKKRQYADDFTLDLTACLQCELCVQVCPEDAIVMVRTAERPTYSREDLILTMPKLYANEKTGIPTWATGSKLLQMQEPPKPPAAAKPAAAPVTAAASTNRTSDKPAAAPVTSAKAPAPAAAMPADVSGEATAIAAAVLASAGNSAVAVAPAVLPPRPNGASKRNGSES